MSIELIFLKKAIEDKNFVSFFYEGKSYKKVKPLKINESLVKCDVGSFEIGKIRKLTILKDRF
ncbi:hypothetical protein [Halarcobacter sp.]|uniref:hypothetical protein n=1 Tax=Halarcobacter sp. TaxID=2321133 RepID=UPI002AAB2F0B|nr:hypothetical protein [Halarcobacter sp.]